jgi:hypothetical protein
MKSGRFLTKNGKFFVSLVLLKIMFWSIYFILSFLPTKVCVVVLQNSIFDELCGLVLCLFSSTFSEYFFRPRHPHSTTIPNDLIVPKWPNITQYYPIILVHNTHKGLITHS